MAADPQGPIGVFDSGVGGLSVLRELQSLMPGEDFLFFADKANVPYGPRPKAEILAFSFAIAEYLFSQGAKLLVVACNTASAAALKELRTTYPDTSIVGMEPAVKPAARGTESGIVAVLATPTTLEGDLYASVLERFATDVTVLQSTCAGLVTEIEAGRLNDGVAEAILREELTPMLEKGIDRVVLGCTHYPFAIPIIERIVGPDVVIVDPAPAVARRTQELLAENGWLNPRESGGATRYITSGDDLLFKQLILDLLGIETDVEKARITIVN
jgi:glutamate racemase